jgi:hypothetical protein
MQERSVRAAALFGPSPRQLPSCPRFAAGCRCLGPDRRRRPRLCRRSHSPSPPSIAAVRTGRKAALRSCFCRQSGGTSRSSRRPVGKSGPLVLPKLPQCRAAAAARQDQSVPRAGPADNGPRGSSCVQRSERGGDADRSRRSWDSIAAARVSSTRTADSLLDHGGLGGCRRLDR